jgi:hypothetical protein
VLPLVCPPSKAIHAGDGDDIHLTKGERPALKFTTMDAAGTPPGELLCAALNHSVDGFPIRDYRIFRRCG